jgi:hypothetical protein
LADKIKRISPVDGSVYAERPVWTGDADAAQKIGSEIATGTVFMTPPKGYHFRTKTS